MAEVAGVEVSLERLLLGSFANLTITGGYGGSGGGGGFGGGGGKFLEQFWGDSKC